VKDRNEAYIESNLTDETLAKIGQFLTKRRLTLHETEECVADGIVALPTGAVTVTSRPMLTSTGDGPIGGTLIFARAFDDAEVERLAKLTHLSVLAAPVSAPDMEKNMASALLRLADGGHVIVAARPHPDRRLHATAGYQRAPDPHRSRHREQCRPWTKPRPLREDPKQGARLRQAERSQLTWRPVNLGATLPEDHPARSIWAVVERA
jgi:hypothetical protein